MWAEVELMAAAGVPIARSVRWSMPESEPLKRCKDFEEIAKDATDFPGCCGSCHEDKYDLGYEMTYVELKDGSTAEVCCRMAGWLESKGLVREE